MEKVFVTGDQWIADKPDLFGYPYYDGVHRGRASSIRDACKYLAERYCYARGMEGPTDDLINEFERTYRTKRGG